MVVFCGLRPRFDTLELYETATEFFLIGCTLKHSNTQKSTPSSSSSSSSSFNSYFSVIRLNRSVDKPNNLSDILSHERYESRVELDEFLSRIAVENFGLLKGQNASRIANTTLASVEERREATNGVEHATCELEHRKGEDGRELEYKK